VYPSKTFRSGGKGKKHQGTSLSWIPASRGGKEEANLSIAASRPGWGGEGEKESQKTLLRPTEECDSGRRERSKEKKRPGGGREWHLEAVVYVKQERGEREGSVVLL